jgi:GNAT superfamily N-acetyltransferase
MKRLSQLGGVLVTQLREGNIVGLIRNLRRRVYSTSRSFGLRRDLTSPYDVPTADIALSIRPLEQADVGILLDTMQSPSRQEMEDRVSRILLVKRGLPTCFVAVDASGTPCFMQWLILPDQNTRLQSIFHGGFPILEPDEALLEDTYTHPRFRGKHIMAHATGLIAEQARQRGIRWLLTFVHESNSVSLKANERAGFDPYVVRKEQWRFFRRSFEYTPLRPGGTS